MSASTTATSTEPTSAAYTLSSPPPLRDPHTTTTIHQPVHTHLVTDRVRLGSSATKRLRLVVYITALRLRVHLVLLKSKKGVVGFVITPQKGVCIDGTAARLPGLLSQQRVDPTEAVKEIAAMTLEGVNATMTELVEVQEEDTHDIYAVIEDTQDRQTRLSQRVNVLIKDREFHQETMLLMEQEALVAAAPITVAAVEQLIEPRVSEALANHETLRNSTNGHGDGSHNSDTRIRGTVRTPREYTYKDFLNCQPFTFKGTEGVVVLS
ncbi:hypothetical protein Tco_0851612 [Tanacetum coccineum]